MYVRPIESLTLRSLIANAYVSIPVPPQSHRIHPQWLQLLDSVGVTLEQLKDMRTAMFIIEFVDKHGGIEEANRQLVGATRTPPHSPVRSRAKSVMVQRGKSYRGRGHRPPTQHSPPPVGIQAPPPLHLGAHLSESL